MNWTVEIFCNRFCLWLIESRGVEPWEAACISWGLRKMRLVTPEGLSELKLHPPPCLAWEEKHHWMLLSALQSKEFTDFIQQKFTLFRKIIHLLQLEIFSCDFYCMNISYQSAGEWWDGEGRHSALDKELWIQCPQLQTENKPLKTSQP